nr:hypothetical protein [Tanacetum cinerariifolium]
MILESVKHGSLIWPTIEENGVIRTKKYVELSVDEKIQADCDMKETNIILQGLPSDIYSLVNHHRAANDLWEIIQLLMQVVASSRFPLSNNQLKTSSNPRNQATIQDGRGTVQQVQGRQCQSYSGTGYKSNANSYGGNNSSEQARVVKCYNCQAQEAGIFLNKEQLAFLADLGVLDGQAIQTIIPDNEVPHSETYLNDMENQSVLAMQDFEQPPAVDFTDNEIYSDSNIILYSQYLQETQQENVQDTHLQTQQDSMEDKYLENEIDLEKKIKELDNILFKVSQSAQTVHMLTKPQVFYDNIHKQALGYQNPFHLKKAQRIKPTLYDGIVMSDKHVAMHVIDDEETLILEEESRSRMSKKDKDPEAIKQNISHKPIDYEKINRLTEDFRKHFTPQQEFSAEHAFWLPMFDPTSKPSDALPVKIEAPKELPKIILVNESLKKLKFHLAKFDNVKIRTTPNARTEAQLQDKDSTICKLKDIIKSLKENFKEDNVNYDYGQIETKNVELENGVAKLSSENECLCNEMNHVK